MRRFVAIVVMLLLPLQSAWSAAANIHGHAGDAASALGFHSDHDAHDHHDDAFADQAAGGHDDGHDDAGHHGGHYHPVFSMLVIEPDLPIGAASPDGPPGQPSASFTSHHPPLFDRPPSVRA